MSWISVAARLAFLPLVLIVLPACSRAPVPILDDPTVAAALVPTAAIALAAGSLGIETPGPVTPPSPREMAIPQETYTPTPLPAIALTPTAYERNPRAVLIEADITGPASSVLRDMHLTTFRLYADGLVVRAGQATPLASGFDAEVRTGRLTEAQIQDLFGYLNATGFFNYSPYYEPRPAPPNLPTANISVYLSKTKTVTVYGPGFPGTPQAFLDAFNRITRTVPVDDKAFVPTDAYLLATIAGSVNEVRSLGEITEWPAAIGQSLAGATDGVTVSGNTFATAARLVSNTPRLLFKEGNQVFRVRLAPNLPRGVHLTDWVGTIAQGVREFEGRAFNIVGYYRGANLLGEASGSPPSPNAWVIHDDTGAMYVTGAAPQLDPNSRAGIWNVVRIRAVVVYIRNGTSYLDARTVSD